MVPTNWTRSWSGWVAQGWNITFFSLVQPALSGSCASGDGGMGGGVEQARCWVLESQHVVPQAPTQPAAGSSCCQVWGGVW